VDTQQCAGLLEMLALGVLYGLTLAT